MRFYEGVPIYGYANNAGDINRFKIVFFVLLYVSDEAFKRPRNVFSIHFKIVCFS